MWKGNAETLLPGPTGGGGFSSLRRLPFVAIVELIVSFQQQQQLTNTGRATNKNLDSTTNDNYFDKYYTT